MTQILEGKTPPAAPLSYKTIEMTPEIGEAIDSFRKFLDKRIREIEELEDGSKGDM